jgi:putative tricarboxylic transport membrane protein
MFEAFTDALGYLTDPITITYIVLGNITGLIFGVLPGLGGAAALAILLPLTYGMDPMVAMFFLAAIMGAVPFGGSISAILLNTPGTAVNAATCLDGHPMAQKGEAKKALEIAATASGLGALFGVFVLILVLPAVRSVILLFGPPEFFILFLFGLATVALASMGSFLKGLIAGGVGILFSLVGYSVVFGDLRFTLGSEHLWDGFSLIPVIVGIFAVSELINYALCGGTIAHGEASISGRSFEGGNPEGVVATEAANNAKDGGALLPTLGLGIPGSVQMAVLLGALVLHGLTPGPLLVKDHLDIVLALVLGLVVSSLLASTFGLLTAHSLARITRINVHYIVPVVLSFCFVGAYALRENIWDVLVALVFGFLGYGMLRFDYSKICFVIGFILGAYVERSFHQSLMMSYGSFRIFLERPITLFLLVLFLFVFIFPFVKKKIAVRNNSS